MEISKLQIDNESMELILLSLPAEANDFALGRDIASHSIDDQLPLFLNVIDSHPGDLSNVRDVAASDAPGLAAVRIGFSDEGYRHLASAAKDRVADLVD